MTFYDDINVIGPFPPEWLRVCGGSLPSSWFPPTLPTWLVRLSVSIMLSFIPSISAFLTSSKMASPINSAEDLAKQTKIKYGTYCCGSTNSFFQVNESVEWKCLFFTFLFNAFIIIILNAYLITFCNLQSYQDLSRQARVLVYSSSWKQLSNSTYDFRQILN